MKKFTRFEALLFLFAASSLLLASALHVQAERKAAAVSEQQRQAWEYASRVFLQTKAERDRFYQQLQRPCSVIWGA